MSNKRVSRDLLQLESTAPTASPFLISPSQAQGALPFPSPPAALTHVPIPFPAAPTALSSAASSSSSSAPGAAAGTGPPRLKTFSIPPSALLSRVAAFLPALALANEKLAADIALHGPAAVDIENLSTLPAESEGSEEADASDADADDADGDEEGDSSMSRPRRATGSVRHIEMDLSLGVLEAQPHEVEGLEAHDIVIPGIAQPAALRGAAGAADSDDSDSGSDDEDDGAARSHGGILLPAASTVGGGSKAARKKRKYRVKNKAKLAAAAAAAAAASASAGGAASPSRDDTPPLPSPAKGGLIQLMEDE